MIYHLYVRPCLVMMICMCEESFMAMIHLCVCNTHCLVLIHLCGGSAETIVRAATLRHKLQIKLHPVTVY